MGTSASNKGPGGRSPLVPPWADADPASPLPTPDPQRFRGFRTEFGRAVRGDFGDGASAYRTSLGKYAREASGGSAIGPRRFKAAYKAGSSLVAAFGELQAGGTGQVATGIDLSRLIGEPLDYAAQEIARALAPPNADADYIAAAIQEAIAEAMPDIEVFEPSLISVDQMIVLMVEFFTRVLFQEITNSAGDAWNKSADGARTTKAESDLMELIRASIDKHMSPSLAGGIQGTNPAALALAQRAALDDVWREWELYR
jgi:hypothetical protein